MINTDRIVPVTKTDLLSLYGVILAPANASLEKLAADDVLGDFSVNAASKVYLANEPVKSVTFGSAITAGTVFFVAANDYTGFKKTGATLTVTAPDEGILTDGTLYKAVLSTNALTITKVGL